MNALNYKQIIPSKYIIPKILLDEYLQFIAIYFPSKSTGRPRIDSEPLIAGIYYLLRTGCQWDALPLCFGSAKTVWHRFKELCTKNIFQQIWKSLLVKYDQEKGLGRDHLSVDTCHKKAPIGGKKTGSSPVDRHKQGIKLGLIVDEEGIPLASLITSGNRNDQKLLAPLLNDLENQISQSKTGDFHTDKGFSCAANRRELISRNFIPVMPKKKPRNKPKPKQEKDEKRWVVERTFSWINRFRRVFVCYEKLTSHIQSFVQMAFQTIILKNI